MSNRFSKWPAFIGLAAMTANVGAPAFAYGYDEHEHETATPIKHLVVIYGENISFDHYFGTYPKATNPSGEPAFSALPGTPKVNNLVTSNMLTNNPNYTNTKNGTAAADPFRLDRSQAATADQNHNYTAEEEAADAGAMDLFPLYTGHGSTGGVGAFGTDGQVMGYYDGNTVQAMWNYAQHFAMSDNSFSDTFGPSTPGALEAVAGQTNSLNLVATSKNSYYVTNTDGSNTMTNDVDPAYDSCSSAKDQGYLTAKNIGDLLNTKNISWGSFMGGFDLTAVNTNTTTGCTRSTYSSTVAETVADYVPHHAWFQYFTSTSNPTHARPSSVAAVGHTYTAGGAVDAANHEYDLNDFYAAVKAGNFPAVTYLKAPAYQDAHPGYSDPLDEQTFVTTVVNFIEKSPQWKDTAIIIAYDDSDGWYDHQYGGVTSSSYSTQDFLTGTSACGTATAPKGVSGAAVNGRCGPGMRQPLIVISPWAKANYVGHNRTSQASIVKFIEDNWLHGERLGGGSFDASAGDLTDLFDFSYFGGRNGALILDTSTGAVVKDSQDGNSQGDWGWFGW